MNCCEHQYFANGNVSIYTFTLNRQIIYNIILKSNLFLLQKICTVLVVREQKWYMGHILLLLSISKRYLVHHGPISTFY